MARIAQTIYTSRPYRPGDEIDIVAMYNLFTGRSKTVEAHLWEWLAPPPGQGSMWVITKIDTGQIVGHHGLIPIPLSYNGEAMLMGKTENTLIHPKHKGKVLYFLFEREFLNEAIERFDLLYTTQGFGTPGRIRLKLGYVAVNSYLNYVKLVRKQALDELITQTIAAIVGSTWLATIIALPLNILAYLANPLWINRSPRLGPSIRLKRITAIEPLMQDLDQLWETSRHDYPMTIDRSSHYLKWRIFDNPNIDYAFFVAFEAKQLVGYTVVEYLAAQARIVDLIVSKNSQEYFDAVLQAVAAELKTQSIDRIGFSTLNGCTYLRHALNRNGFYAFAKLKTWLKVGRQETSDDIPELMVKAVNTRLDPDRLVDANNWYYTDIFTEGVQRD